MNRPRVPESHSIAASNDDIFTPMVQSLEQQRQLQNTLSTQEHIHVSSQPRYTPTSAINQSQTYHKDRGQFSTAHSVAVKLVIVIWSCAFMFFRNLTG